MATRLVVRDLYSRLEEKLIMNDLSSRIASLTPQQKKLFIERLNKRPDRSAGHRISARPGGSNLYPLSFAQQRLWFLHQLELGGLAYNLPFALRLTGPLDVIKLERCLNEIVRRHEILRTTFAAVDEQPMQVIAPSLTMSIPVIDLRELDEAQLEAEARRLVSQDARRAFDLARGPLFSFTVLRLRDLEYVWMLTMHHIIADGWSIGLFVNELTLLYEGIHEEPGVELPPLPIQYADFAVWQREWLQGEVLERELAFWKDELAGAPHRLDMPTDYPRPDARSFRGARESFSLAKEQKDAIAELSRAEGVTLFMTLLAVYEVLLYHLTRCADIVVGCLIANRNHLETENLIGFFVNQLVLRADLSANPTFKELLKRVRLATLNAFEHQELPYQSIVDALHVERDLSRNPLFQANFTFQNTPITALKIGDMIIEGIAPADDSLALDVDLALLISESPQGLYFVMRYSTDLFNRATIKQMLRRIETIILQATARPDALLSELTDSIAEAENQFLETQMKDLRTRNTKNLERIKRRRSPASLRS